MRGGPQHLWTGLATAAGQRLRAFPTRSEGGLSVILALSLLALALLVAGGIEMADLFSERTKMRNVADSTALWGASSIALSGKDGAEERAKAFAEDQLAKTPLRMATTVESHIVDLGDDPQHPKPGLRIVIRGARESFFGNLFPPGGFKVSVASTALSVSKVPLCILGMGNKDVVKIRDTSNVLAGGCLVHSNQDLRVDGGAKVEAGLAQAVNTASGPIDPDANSGAKPIEDPFSKLDVSVPSGRSGCSLIELPLIYDLGLVNLPATYHCRDIVVAKNATLRLAPGVHYFVHAKLKLQENSSLIGTDGSVMVFDKDSTIDWGDGAKVDLVGMKKGPLAGFLIVGTRDNDHDFRIAADNVEQLLGTIYIPNAKLVVEGKEKVAGESAWTVIVAKRVELKGNPTLVMNTDYGVGGVPVPTGVGSKTMDSRIVE